MRKLKIVTIAIMALSFAAGCGKAAPTKIKDGGYSATDVKGAGEAAAAPIKAISMTVDRSQMRVAFGTDEGKMNIPMGQTKQETWPKGCDQLLEVIELKKPLAAGALKIAKPVLVVGCPANSGNVVLREAGEIEGEDPCKGAAGACITWSPK
jgi:hypothetical protein